MERIATKRTEQRLCKVYTWRSYFNHHLLFLLWESCLALLTLGSGWGAAVLACSPVPRCAALAWPGLACQHLHPGRSPAAQPALLPLLRAGVLQGFSIPFDLLLLSLGKVTASLGWGPNSCLLAAINPEVLLHICWDASYLGHCFTFPACSLNNRFWSSSIATNPSYTRARRHASSAGKTMPLSPSYC